MSHWENNGRSDEWYTPQYVFDALGCRFDLDVAAPYNRQFVCVPADKFITNDSLKTEWSGFVWCNPPFGKRNTIDSWITKSHLHGNSIVLTPDRTSASWWQSGAEKADCVLFVHGKIKFVRPDGTTGNQPSNGTTLFAYGEQAVKALHNAQQKLLGIIR